MTVLKSCPFCGGDATIIAGLAGCQRCAVGRRSAAAWNRRAAPPAPADEHLREIRERCEKASVGPWSIQRGDRKARIIDGGGHGVAQFATHNSRANRAFAAAAKQDIPYLLDVIASLQARVAEAEAGADFAAGKAIEWSQAVDDMRKCCTDWQRQAEKMRAAAEAAEAERDRLAQQLADERAGAETLDEEGMHANDRLSTLCALIMQCDMGTPAGQRAKNYARFCLGIIKDDPEACAALKDTRDEQKAVAFKPTHRHWKGGLYQVLHRGHREADLMPVVVYRGKDGTVWVRDVDDFDAVLPDGGFTPAQVAEVARALEDK